MPAASITVSSRLPMPAPVAWGRATSMSGIAHELWPLLQMTVPAHLTGLTVADAPLGVRVARSRLLLLGVLPVGRIDVTLVELTEGRFVEESPMTGMRRWRHERTVVPDGDKACVVTDRLTAEPRLRLLAPAARLLVRGLFAHRHHRLRQVRAR